MQLIVKGIEKSFVINADSNDTVADIKKSLFVKYGIESSDQVLFSSSHVYLDSDTVKDIPSKSMNLLVKCVGGRQHGSLMHVGKVRNRTPKIPKTEKKRGKTGRSHRREQYNKRMKSVKVTTGRRVGPNSNANKK